MRGEVVDVRGQAAQHATIPANPATKKTPASALVPTVLLAIIPLRLAA
jgi:hypothetical protein